MIKSPEIKVNPDVLKTLRESSGYTVEEIAKKLRPLLLKSRKLRKDLVAKKGQAHYPLCRGWEIESDE